VLDFLVEVYIPRGMDTPATPSRKDIARVTEQLRREGTRVRLVRSIFVPQDETCFYLFRALNGEAVREAGTRAGLHFDRVLEARSDWGIPAHFDQPHHPTKEVSHEIK
jgi:hypothetical protein